MIKERDGCKPELLSKEKELLQVTEEKQKQAQESVYNMKQIQEMLQDNLYLRQSIKTLEKKISELPTTEKPERGDNISSSLTITSAGGLSSRKSCF